MKVSVILPAAGLGTRMGRAVPEKAGTSRKQFMLLEGSPILLHTIRKFASTPAVSEIVVALRPEDIEWVRELLAEEKFGKPVRLVEGGDSRQESVEHALATLGAGTELVAVHDAVRPFIEHSVLEKVFAEAEETGAAIVGIVPVDTVKQVHRNKIRQTIPRERLILAQTPQVFRFDLLKSAFAKAREDGFAGTDESSLVERLDQVEVSVVPGSDRNLKITKPSDMDLARLFLAEEMTARGLEVERVSNWPGLGRTSHRRRPADDPGRRNDSFRIWFGRPFGRRHSFARHHRCAAGRAGPRRYRHALSRHRSALERRRQPDVPAARAAS